MLPPLYFFQDHSVKGHGERETVLGRMILLSTRRKVMSNQKGHRRIITLTRSLSALQIQSPH